ncbi:hypothetical protein LQZ19_00300 [Treponema primitia]|uniref:hypothetical protein n=1 Tax=Treponema primitia TaxID=88058 RepID=UPI00398170BE
MSKENDALWRLYTDAEEDGAFEDVRAINDDIPNLVEKATYPLFLHVSDEYLQADIKLMVFGQETNAWNYKKQWGEDKIIYGSSKEIYVEDITNFYNDFLTSPPKTPFWQGTKKIIDMLQTAINPKTVDYIWNNIVKMGKHGMHFPDKWYEPVIKPYFNSLILKEIEILKPDFAIFFTGPTSQYESVIGDVFGIPERKGVTGFDRKDLCEVVIPGVTKAYRTYHPGYLQRNPNMTPNKQQIFEAIVKGFAEKT